jgi:hypothetical protein
MYFLTKCVKRTLIGRTNYNTTDKLIRELPIQESEKSNENEQQQQQQQQQTKENNKKNKRLENK